MENDITEIVYEVRRKGSPTRLRGNFIKMKRDGIWISGDLYEFLAQTETRFQRRPIEGTSRVFIPWGKVWSIHELNLPIK